MSAHASRLGQLLLTGIPSTELDSATAARLKKLQPGGFILFGRNIQSAAQVRKLCDDLRGLSEIEPIITIDQEGGRVSRTRYIGSALTAAEQERAKTDASFRFRHIGQEPPNAQSLRMKGDPELIRRHGQLTGQILRLFGINLDLCPVLDISYDDTADNSLKGRCYGTDPQQVVDFAGIFNRAMRKEGVLSCAKHFPGYGPAECDPHEFLPIIEKSRDALEREELLPYRTLMPELDSVMVCHANYRAYDPQNERWPASLSHNIVQKLLRDQLGFEGLAMTDDLDMGAIVHRYGFGDAIVRSLVAGNDLAMICHQVHRLDEARAALESAPRAALDRALAGVAAFKERLAPPVPEFSEEAFRAVDAEIWQLRVDTLGEERARDRTPDVSKRSPVEIY